MVTEIELFVTFCRARSFLYGEFQRRLSDTNEDLDEVSSHSIFDIFEFLFMLSATNIDTGEKIGLLARAHNGECERLMSLDPASLSRLGLNRTKVHDSMFSDKNIRKLDSNFQLMKAIDQSDVSRFLFKHMSRETVRKSLILFGRAKLVKRIDAGDSILIKPNGEAESLFQRYLLSLMRSSADEDGA